MAKVYSKEELKEKALEVFKAHPSESTVFMTTDGQGFFRKNHADLNAKQKGKSDAPLRTYRFEKSEVEAKEDIKDQDEMSWQARVKRMETAQSAEEVEEYLEGETSQKVKEAAEARLEELKAEE